VSEIRLITPVNIHGVGGNIQAVGQGTVQLHLRCSAVKLHDKLLHNAYNAPHVPVRLISIPQLGRDTSEQSYICTGGSESTLVWSDSSIVLQHSPQSGVPFLQAYLGNEKLHAFYNMCYLAHNGTATIAPECISTDRDNLETTSSTEVHDDNPTTESTQDVCPHLDATVTHMCNLLHHPRQNATKHDYALWHYELGHLPHSQLQLLLKQGKLPKRFKNCDPLVCPACLFAKQSKQQWHYKGSHHHLRSLGKGVPGSLTFADYMIRKKPWTHSSINWLSY
jgi:hypothetical protein